MTAKVLPVDSSDTAYSSSNPLPVGTSSGQSSATPTISAASYSAGQCIGGLMSFSGLSRGNDKTGYVQSVSIICKSLQSANLDLVLFNDIPASGIVNGSALAIASGDAAKVIDVIHLSDWTQLNTSLMFLQANNLARPYKPKTGTDTIYGALVARAATSAFGSTSDLTVTLKAPQD